MMYKFFINSLVIFLAACPFVGIGLALWTNNAYWLLLCFPLLIFLS